MPAAIFIFPTKSKCVPGLINSILFSSVKILRLNADLRNASVPDKVVKDNSCDEDGRKHTDHNADAQGQGESLYRAGAEGE
jgi:hypothetical protein